MSITDILIFIPGEEENLRRELRLPDTVSIPAISEQINITRGEIVQFQREVSGTIDPMKLQSEAQKFLDRKYTDSRRDTQRATVSGTTDVRLGMAEQNLTYAAGISADVNIIRSIDWQKPVEVQSQAMSTVSLALGTIATKLSKPGQKPEDFDSLEKLAKLDLRKYPDLNAQEKNVIELVRTGLGKGDTPVLTYMRTEWTEKLRTQAPYGAALGEFQQAAKTGDWTSLSMDNPIMEFAKDNKVITGLAVAGVAFGLYKLFGGMFGGEDDKKEDSKGGKKDFIDSFSEYIPGGKASIGVLIALVAAVGIFKPEWFTMLKDKITGKEVPDKRTLKDTAKALVDPKIPASERVKLVKELVDKLPIPGLGIMVSGLSLATGADLEKKLADIAEVISGWNDNRSDSSGSNNPETYSGAPLPILIARGTQFYYGAIKPYAKLNNNEKHILTGSVANVWDRFFGKNPSYEYATQKLPEMEAQKTALTNPNWETETARIKAEFNNGTHSQYGSIVDIAEKELHAKMMVDSRGNKIVSPKLEQDVFRFIAEREVITKLQVMEAGIQSIQGGPQKFAQLQVLRGNPEGFYTHLQKLEEGRLGLHGIVASGRSVNTKDWIEFSRLGDGYEKALVEKEKIIKTHLSEIHKLQAEYKLDTTNADRKTAIELKVREKGYAIASIENDVQKSVGKMLETEKLFANVLSEGNTHAMPFSFSKIFNRFFVGNDRAENLSQLKLVDPETKLFRFRMGSGGMVLMGVGMTSLLWADGLDPDKLKHDVTRMAAGLVPYYGTYLDSVDLTRSIRNAEWMNSFANLGAMIASGFGDVLFTLSLPFWETGIGAAAGIGAKGAMATIRSMIKPGTTAQLLGGASDILKTGVVKVSMTDAAGKVIIKEIPISAQERIFMESIKGAFAPNVPRIQAISRYGIVGGMGTALAAGVVAPLAMYSFGPDNSLRTTNLEPELRK
ncbi:MAG: hypothetical protein PHH70_00275 [Candidatus Gracilibacteria bacterium]|nr:hypothetical protein [Candidatus Gracilibacteria bacterium]